MNYCRKFFRFGKWIECDLETESISLIQENNEKIAVICSDVIEHLVNPSNLLNQIHNLMDHAEFCILTTPERDLVRGESDLGPPENIHHIREWNMKELENLLQNFQLKTAFVGLTARNDIMILKNQPS